MSAPITDLADDRLVIALDFGTTFSGVAYAFNTPGKKADIVPIEEWPGKLNFLSFIQTPSPWQLLCLAAILGGAVPRESSQSGLFHGELSYT